MKRFANIILLFLTFTVNAQKSSQPHFTDKQAVKKIEKLISSCAPRHPANPGNIS